jgi:hypothetical protein
MLRMTSTIVNQIVDKVRLRPLSIASGKNLRFAIGVAAIGNGCDGIERDSSSC